MPEIVEPPVVEVKLEEQNQQQNTPAPGTPEYAKGLAEAFANARNGVKAETPAAKIEPVAPSTTQTQKAEETPAAKPTEAPTQAPTQKELTAEDALAFINKTYGLNIASGEDIKGALADRTEKERLGKIVESISEFTPEEIARIKAGRELKDYTLYDKVMNLKPAELTDRDALREEFILKNPGRSQAYINEKFEREYRAKYTVKEPDDVEDADYKRDVEFAKLSLDEDAKDARKYIDSKQQELKKYGIVEGVANRAEQQRLIKEKAAELRTNWAAAVDKTLETTSTISFDIEGVPVTVAMDVAEKTEVRKAMDDPMSYLQTIIGYNPDNHTFDPQKLFRFAMKEIAEKRVVQSAFKAGATHKHEELLKNRQTTNTAAAGEGEVKLTPREEALKAAEQIRNHRAGVR